MEMATETISPSRTRTGERTGGRGGMGRGSTGRVESVPHIQGIPPSPIAHTSPLYVQCPHLLHVHSNDAAFASRNCRPAFESGFSSNFIVSETVLLAKIMHNSSVLNSLDKEMICEYYCFRVYIPIFITSNTPLGQGTSWRE